jgi:hypothetical protein
MNKVWAWWMSYTDRKMDPGPLVAVRILVCGAIGLDLLRMVQLGLFSDVFSPFSLGGLSLIQDPHWVLGAWMGESASAIALAVTLMCMGLAGLGLWMRPAILIGVLAYAQLGHLFPPGDRAIDRLLRSVLLVLMFSAADQMWSPRRPNSTPVPAWPADLIRYMVVLVYLSAGLGKLIQQPGWLSLTADPPLMRILIDPLAGNLDPSMWAGHPWLFRLGGFVTIAFELASPLLLTRHGPKLALLGFVMHLSIAFTMNLGMFSWGMLAIYPLFLTPFILQPQAQTLAD